MSGKTNDAKNRIWDDNAAFSEVQVPDAHIRISDEALKILREQGTEAYESYVTEQLEK